ncbi:MAG TPA: hypothetical protein VHC63_13275 [Acidimicrobiales bacterium]|nr:hypothetical protein [Acidimicrobiales bacterium]
MTSPYTAPKKAPDPVRLLKIVVALLVVIVVGMCAVFAAGYLSLRANDRAIIQARSEARHRECLRDNDELAKAIQKERESWKSFIFRSFDAQGIRPTPAQEAQIAPFLAEQEAAVRKEYSDRAPRPCTKQSEDAHYRAQALEAR